MRAVAALPHRKFSVDEYHKFIDTGVFRPEERLELWEGEFIEMSPIGKRHAGCVNELSELLRDFLEKNAIISTQNPIVLDDFSEPQPDLSVLIRREDFYRETGATAKDVLLVIEVADSTARYDRFVKFPGYAANGIQEAWLIDLEKNRVEIHSSPSESGYKVVETLKPRETAQSKILPQIKISVDDILR